ncbi:MAG: anhydro-N-acetylmuramic acid kinase [Alphaproteobacteria bacterium]|nr:anhydro-N-acetylmuramic acid kinase [Alphaproteobacteria bacterium]
MDKKMYRAIGLMSGTSMDGVDVALIETDGVSVSKCNPGIVLPYEYELRSRLRALIKNPMQEDVLFLEDVVTRYHIKAINVLLESAKLTCQDIDVIGFPGQTIIHRPQECLTWQMGNAAKIYQAHKIPVIADFRRSDMAAGGQGAPLVPVYHAALCRDLKEKTVAVVNIGGVANVTYIDRSDEDGVILAFDTGPGNAHIDDIMFKHTGQTYDHFGETAAKGRIHQPILDQLLQHAYFSQTYPKSLDRHTFDAESLVDGLPFQDAVATMTAFTAHAICKAQELMPKVPQRWLICGGGRLNETILKHMRQLLGHPVDPCEKVAWDGDGLEAQAFGYLAVRCLLGLPITFEKTTGAQTPVTSAAYYGTCGL